MMTKRAIVNSSKFGTVIASAYVSDELMRIDPKGAYNLLAKRASAVEAETYPDKLKKERNKLRFSACFCPYRIAQELSEKADKIQKRLDEVEDFYGARR